MRTTFRSRLRDSLMWVGMYAVGIIPGSILDMKTPTGYHLSYVPLMLGFLVGLWIGGGLWWLVEHLFRPSDMREFVAIMLLTYSVALTGPALVRYLNKGLDHRPVRAYTTTILAVHRPNKGPMEIVITDWRDPSESIALVGSGTIGDSVTVYIHRGWLNFPWIDGR